MIRVLAVLLLSHLVVLVYGQDTFTNPLLPSGADPWSIYKDGYYCYTHTLGDRIGIWKVKNLTDLKTAKHPGSYREWTPPPGTMYSKQLWAPEIHFIDDKWYVYFAADDGKNENHRMYVLENSSPDPLDGEWVFKGKISDPTDKWAIDGSVFEHRGELYMVWSGWEGDVDGRQDIFIAKMKNPWTIEGNRVKISTPTFDWEKHGDLNDPNPRHVNVNEGPQILKNKDKIFVIYSASGCWTDFYALGMLTASATSDLLKPESWKKSPQPVFSQSLKNEVYAPGHNSFFKSPDGTENWILYHANSEPGQGCSKHRSPRAQRFNWKEDGSPDFGEPVKEGLALPRPSSNN